MNSEVNFEIVKRDNAILVMLVKETANGWASHEVKRYEYPTGASYETKMKIEISADLYGQKLVNFLNA